METDSLHRPRFSQRESALQCGQGTLGKRTHGYSTEYARKKSCTVLDGPKTISVKEKFGCRSTVRIQQLKEDVIIYRQVA